MKKVLTDSKTGRKFAVLIKDEWLPALGEDGLQYYVFTANLTMWNGEPRDDCHVVDLKERIAICAIKRHLQGVITPLEYIFDKESFDAANSIEEYVEMIRKKGLTK